MMVDWTALHVALEASGATCLVQRDGEQMVSAESGIRPLLSWLRETPDTLYGALVADKVVGKAAALLLVHGGVAGVWAGVISEPAAAVLERAGILFAAGERTARIRNRAGTGLCPMEARVLAIEDPAQAYRVLQEAVFGQSGDRI